MSRNHQGKMIQITLEQDANPSYWGYYLIDRLTT
jgi:hypothetical protein